MIPANMMLPPCESASLENATADTPHCATHEVHLALVSNRGARDAASHALRDERDDVLRDDRVSPARPRRAHEVRLTHVRKMMESGQATHVSISGLPGLRKPETHTTLR